jgi:hypothetical protein
MKIFYIKGSEKNSEALSRRENLEDLTEEIIIDFLFSKRDSKDMTRDSVKKTLKNQEIV